MTTRKSYQLFTPRHGQTNKRLKLRIEAVQLPRGGPWEKIVTDRDGHKWRAVGAPCNIAGCFCDAIAWPLKEETHD